MSKKTLPQVEPTVKDMIEKYQCPGCVAGMDITCGAFKPEIEDGMFRCNGHCPGTTIVTGAGATKIMLGLPRAFARLGVQAQSDLPKIRLWQKGSQPIWDKYNVPVWAMVHEGDLIVRTYMPRSNYPIVDVIEGGTLEMCRQAINVGEFYDEIG